MKKNPYTHVLVGHNGEQSDIKDLRFSGQSGKAIASNGELNAGSRKEMIAQISNLMNVSASGRIQKVVTAETKQARRAHLNEAYQAGVKSDKWQSLGSVLAAEITLTNDREGLCRRMLITEEIPQGQIPTVRIREKQMVTEMRTSEAAPETTYIKNKRMYPAEFWLTGRCLVSERDIAQSTDDLLGEAYEDGLESIMTQEDRLWKRACDEAASIENDIQYYSQLSPVAIANMVNQISNWGLVPGNAVLASDLWADIISNPDFSNWFDPITQYELLLTGQLGALLGVNLITDAFREKKLKVLEAGEMYVTALPDYHGQLTTRGPVTPTPADMNDEGQPYIGWNFKELITLVVANARSVAKGQRIK